jgi:hypothetical protein
MNMTASQTQMPMMIMPTMTPVFDIWEDTPFGSTDDITWEATAFGSTDDVDAQP